MGDGEWTRGGFEVRGIGGLMVDNQYTLVL